MKKMMKIAAIAVAASLALVACKNTKAEEPVDTIDSTIEQVMEDEMVADSVVDTTVVAEEVTPAPAKKTTVKKAEAQPKEAGLAENQNASKKVVETKPADEINKTNTVKREGRR